MNKVNSRQPIELVFSGASGKLKDTNIPEAIIEGNNSITVQNLNTMGEQQSNTVGDFFRRQFTTESGREQRADRKASKNKLRDAEANQTNALAQALITPSEGGLSTGAIIGIALGGVLLLGGITLLIIKSKKK